MTTNQIAITDGPDRADFYGSLGFGNNVLFHFGNNDFAEFRIQSVEIESGERRSWNIGAVLVDCSQSKTLKGMSFAEGDLFSGFYTVLNSRRGHLIPKKPMFYFCAELDYNRLVRISIDGVGSINHLTIPFGNKKVDVLMSKTIIDSSNKCVIIYGSIDHGDIKDVFGDKLVINQEVRIFYDAVNHAGFLSSKF